MYKIFVQLMRSLRARRKLLKKRNVHVVHEHFEVIFNAAISDLISCTEIFRSLGKNPDRAPFSQN